VWPRIVVTIKVSEVGGQLVTKRKPSGCNYPASIYESAALHVQRKGGRPSQFVFGALGNSFQQPKVVKPFSVSVEFTLALPIGHFDFRFWLLGRATMGPEDHFPGFRNLIIVFPTALLTILRQLRLSRKVPKFVGVGPDHQTHNLVGTLLIE